MDVLGVKNFAQLAKYMPGVTFDPGPQTTYTSAASIPRPVIGTTGIYIDDTPIQIRNLGFSSNKRCPPSSIWNGWRCCADRKGRCSARVLKAAPCVTLRRSRA